MQPNELRNFGCRRHKRSYKLNRWKLIDLKDKKKMIDSNYEKKTLVTIGVLIIQKYKNISSCKTLCLHQKIMNQL